MKGLCLFALVAWTAASSVHAAQGAPRIDDVKATVFLADATAPPDWEMRVRLSVTVVEGTEVGRMTMKIDYPSIFKYLRVEPGDPLKTPDVELTVKPVAATAKSETASLLIEVQPMKGGRIIAAGAIGNLVFRIDDKATPGPMQMSAVDVRAWAPSPGGLSIPAAPGPVAKITVAPAGLPIFNCFFYMHD